MKDANGVGFWVYFYSLNIIGAQFMLNLVLGVLSGYVYTYLLSYLVSSFSSFHTEIIKIYREILLTELFCQLFVKRRAQIITFVPDRGVAVIQI